MSYPTCNHLKEDGVYCDSPALRGQRFCYFHLSARARRVQAAQARRRGESCRIQVPVLDDMHAVQVSLMQVLDALADDRIDHKRAALMLYALQQASTNLNSTPNWKGSRPRAEYDHPLRAVEAPTLEAQYELPNDIDLDAPPDVAVAQAELQANLPPAQPASKPAPEPLERVPQIHPRSYYRHNQNGEYEDLFEDKGPGSYYELRRIIDEVHAANPDEFQRGRGSRFGDPDLEDDAA
jgi:hypothetical protein